MKKRWLVALLSIFLIAGFNLSNIRDAYASGEVWNFGYTGSVQSFTAPYTGNYQLEVWGAQGGSSTYSQALGGNGGYSVGLVHFNANQTIYVYVGGMGQSATNEANEGVFQGGYNGGGNSFDATQQSAGGGGGATDIRTSSDGFWQDDLNQRIIVAGGGGGGANTAGVVNGGAGGGLNGLNGSAPNTGIPGKGGGQSSGGLGQNGYIPSSPGGFGYGGSVSTIATDACSNAGGGGGWYGGSSGGSMYTHPSGYGGSGGGGSSYIGGVQDGTTIVGNQFMPSPYGGNEVGQLGNGYARITALDTPPIATITSPTANSQYAPGTNMLLSGSIYDPDAQNGYTMSVLYSVDGGTPITGSVLSDTTFSQNFSVNIPLASSLSIGNHTLNVWTTDSHGASSSQQSITFSVKDTVPPKLTVSGNPISWTNQNVTLTVTATDNVSVHGIQLPDDNWVYASSASYAVSSNGSYTFVAQDGAGNQTSQTVNVTDIDQQSPTLKVMDKRLESGLTGNIVFDGNTITNRVTGKTYLMNQTYGGGTYVDTPYGKGIKFSGGQIQIPNSDLGISDNTNTVTVSFVMNWSGENNVIPIGFYTYDIWIVNGFIGFNTGQGDLWGTSVPSSITNQYGVVTAIFDKGEYKLNSLYINGQKQAISQEMNQEAPSFATFGDNFNISSWDSTYPYYLLHSSIIGNVLVWNRALGDDEVQALCNDAELSGWTNQNITLDAYASDNVAVKNITLPDGSVVNTNTASYTATQNGNYVFKANDEAGNQTTQTVSINNIDKTAPSLTIAPNTTNWATSVTLTATANDTQSGVQKIQLPDGNWVNGAIANYEVSSDGVYSFTALDNLGNASVQSIKVTNIDNTVPILTLTPNTENWTNSNVIITATASDAQSGVKQIQTPDGVWHTGSSVTYSVPSNGSYQFVVYDNVGNQTTQSITVNNIDKVSPELFLTSSTTDWISTNVTITATATDDSSGVKAIQTPNGDWVNGSSIMYEVTSNGTYSFIAEDMAGNETSQTITVNNIDKDAPSLTITPSTTNWTPNVVTLSVIGSDATSGVQAIQTPDGNWVTGSSTDYSVSTDGTYTFIAEDFAGNQTIKSFVVSNIDNTKPTVPTISNNENWTNASSITVNITAGTDTQSGVNTTEYELEGATTQGWTKYSAPFNVVNEGVTTVVARTIDNVGLDSDEVTSKVKIDRTAPYNTEITIVPHN